MIKLWGASPLSTQMKQADSWLWSFSAAANVLLLASPLYMTQVYSRVLPSHGIDTLLWLTLIILAALAVHGFVEMLRALISQKLSARYELTASSMLLRDGISNPRNGQIADAMRDAAIVKQSLASKVYLGLYDLPFAPLFLLVAFLCHPAIGVLTFCGGALLALLAYFNNRNLGDTSKIVLEHQNKAARYASAALDASEPARAMGMGQALFGRWRTEALNAASAADDAGTTNAAYYGLTRFVRQALQTAVLGLGAYLVLTGQMNAGLIFAASLLSGRTLQPIEQLIGGWRQLQASMAAHGRVEALLGQLDLEAGAEPVPLPDATGRIDLQNVGVSVDGPRGMVPLIQAINLSASPGEILAIMGPSGSGKSTLARTIAGITPPTEGHVRLDDFELAQWPIAQRGAAIGYMGQETGLLTGTLAENIARFSDASDPSEVVIAAQRAHAHEFISRLPDGYSTRIGIGGVRLSGGQTQRIGLARALYGNPSVLILDEPNAHLDADGEQALNQALLESRQRGCTVIVVSQRNTILGIADRVVLVRSGRIEPMRKVATPMARPSDAAAAQAKATPITLASVG